MIHRNESGQGGVEYAFTILVVVAVLIVILFATGSFPDSITKAFSRASDTINGVAVSGGTRGNDPM